MELCDDCRRLKIARILKGMQKFDKYVLAIHKEQFSHGFLESLSDAGKSTFALLEWMSWWIHGPSPARGSRLYRSWYNEPLGRATGVVVAELGSRLRRTSLTNCELCNLLANIRIPDCKRVSNADVLVACRYFKDPSRWQRWDREGTPSDIVVMAVLPKYRWDGHWGTSSLTRSMDRSEPRGFLTCRLKNSKSDVSQSTQAPQPAIDFSEISRLVRSCQKSHGNCQKETTTSRQPIPICLVDCYSRKLIQTASSESYVALSYVWGGVSAGTLDSGTLPRTLEDAIQVTQSLGFRYIWIDQFCVNQDDCAIKYEQIRTMSMVYADAVVTLVAASGSDANHGLPGAPNHPFPRKGRHSVVMDGCIISEEAAPIDLGIQNSTWTSRGWTFQEQFFSQRFLVFGLGQVSYECRLVKYSPRHGIFSHWAEGPSQNRRPEWVSLYSRLHDRKTGENSHLGIRGSYHHLVAQYWPRQLSLDSDGINGFSAILEHLKTLWDAELIRIKNEDDISKYRITFTAGIPHLLRRKAESPDPDLKVFVEGLVWYCYSRIKRREGFPSWCWAGWVPLGTHASISWTDSTIKQTPSIRNVFFRSSPAPESSGGPRNQKPLLQRVPIADHEFPSVPEAVIFDAPVIRSSAVSWPDGESRPSLWRQMAFWRFADARVLKPDEFLSNIANEAYCLVALSHQEHKSEYSNKMRFTILLVRQVGQYRYERIGLVTTSWLIDISWAQCNKDLELRTWELI